MQEIAFRLDSSHSIGSGHLVRCLSLAQQLKSHGFNSLFICKKLEGSQSSTVKNSGFTVYEIDSQLNEIEDANKTLEVIRKHSPEITKIVIDHYQITDQFEQFFKSIGFTVVAIDDLGVKKHVCDLLIDQNYRLNYETVYTQVPTSTQKYLGPEYSLLRQDFLENTHKPTRKVDQIKNIFVFFGGGDPTGETLRFIQTLNLENLKDLYFYIMTASSNRYINEIKKTKRQKGLNLLIDPPNIPEVMNLCQLYFGSSGSVTWERFCMQLGGYVVSTADNQINLAQSLHQQELTWYLGHASQYNYTNVLSLISETQHQKINELNHQRSLIHKVMQSHKLSKIIDFIKGC